MNRPRIWVSPEVHLLRTAATAEAKTLKSSYEGVMPTGTLSGPSGGS